MHAGSGMQTKSYIVKIMF